MTSLWRHLWPNYDTLGFKILTQCVKMLGERVLQVWRWYLHRFRRYRKKTRGGARNSPPPVGRGLIPTRWYLSIRIFITFGQNKAWPEVAKAVFFQINRSSFYILREDFTFTSSGTVNFTSMLAVIFSNRENPASSSIPPPPSERVGWQCGPS